MPVMDGYDATKIIRGLNSKIPIIAQTAYAFSSEVENALNVGCSDYITKPINKNELLAKIIFWTNKPQKKP